MKRIIKKRKGLVKGTSSAMLLSILIHVGLFLLAGILVVFTVVKKEEQVFEPPKSVERPKMKLKKPKVRTTKSTKPKAAKKIATTMKTATMPDIQLPGLGGMGDGLGDGGLGGFDMMPDLEDTTVFGSGQSIGNDLEGIFYDFKRDITGRAIPVSNVEMADKVARFVRGGWNTSQFARYYRSSKKLYATSIMVPPIISSLAPRAFNELDTIGYAWMVHYKGQLVHADGIKFRFWGQADDFMVVRVNGEVVLAATWPAGHIPQIAGGWYTAAADSDRFYLGNQKAIVGDWVTLEPGVSQDLEIIIGEVNGGTFYSMLLVEVDGVNYEKSKRQSMPVLPMFRTEEPAQDLIDVISKTLVPGEACLTNGPVFRDYTISSRRQEEEVDETPEPEGDQTSRPEVLGESPTRRWSQSDGKTVEADYVSLVAEQVVLRTASGKQLKIPVEQLSPEDRTYVDLCNPPALSIDFTRKVSVDRIPTQPYFAEPPSMINTYVFGVKVNQTSPRQYNGKLNVEYFAVGKRLNKPTEYVLLDRQSSSFIPANGNDRSHRFSGERVEVITYYTFDKDYLGDKYAENLVVVTDERGEIIAHNTSAKWLFANLEKLREMPVGRYMDKSCTRIIPTGPESRRY